MTVDAREGPSDFQDIVAVSELPQSTMNNYFSIGSDAYTALRVSVFLCTLYLASSWPAHGQFHLARQARPESFDSRIRNKAHYGLLGAKEVLQHRFRNLSRFITLEVWHALRFLCLCLNSHYGHEYYKLTAQCDGEDKTELLKAKRIEAVIFLNISSYAGGTRPWGTKAAADDFRAPSVSDHIIEVCRSPVLYCATLCVPVTCAMPYPMCYPVHYPPCGVSNAGDIACLRQVVGFEDAFQMAKGQIGLGHAVRIAQCRKAVISMKCAVPAQVAFTSSTYTQI